MKVLPTFLLACLLSFSVHAQDWLWGRGDTGTGMDGWPVATDPFGNVYGAGIAFNAGTVHFGSVSVNVSGSSPCVLVKYNGSGNVQWARTIQGGYQWLINITCDRSGNVFLMGTLTGTATAGSITLNNPSSKPRYFVVKYDPSGNELWGIVAGDDVADYISTPVSYVLGAGGLTCDATGNLYVLSSFKSSLTTVGTTTLTNSDPSGNTYDIMLVKYAPSGTVTWAKSYGGPDNDYGLGVTVTPSNDIYIDGVFQSGTLAFGSTTLHSTPGALLSTQMNGFIARLNGSGGASWATATVGIGYENAVGIASDATGSVYVTGGFRGNALNFGGAILNNPNAGSSAMYLVKFNSANSVDWSKIITGVGADTSGELGTWGYCIAMSDCGVIWVSGVMNSPVIIDGHTLDTPAHNTDPIFIAGYSTTGNYVASAALQSGGDDQNGIACDPGGNIYMCSDYWGFGIYGGTLANDYFVVGPDVLPKDSSVIEAMFVAKYPTQNGAQSFKHSDTTICFQQEMTLRAPSGHSSYIWSTGRDGQTCSIKDTGTIWVCGTDSCASFADTFHVAKCGCNSWFVPNTFTPNGDAQNDVFYPRNTGSQELVKSFRVYDRWGELLFERNNFYANDPTYAWDGAYNGTPPRPEVYVWVMDAWCDDAPTTLKGTVTIIK